MMSRENFSCYTVNKCVYNFVIYSLRRIKTCSCYHITTKAMDIF